MDRKIFICEKLQKLGYARERRVRLYGEELRLTSNPVADGTGFSVEGLAVRTGNLRRLRIPLTVVEMLEREVTEQEAIELELVA
jgi:hypothetical protein